MIPLRTCVGQIVISAHAPNKKNPQKIILIKKPVDKINGDISRHATYVIPMYIHARHSFIASVVADPLRSSTTQLFTCYFNLKLYSNNFGIRGFLCLAMKKNHF